LKHTERKQAYRTFRLLDADRELLRHIGKDREGVPDRYHALLEVAQLVAELPKPPKKEVRRSIRLGIPNAVTAAIEKRQKKTGETFVDILLATCRLYRERYPRCISQPK
jgi:hypothetical protein